jgi:hypothetical protein
MIPAPAVAPEKPPNNNFKELDSGSLHYRRESQVKKSGVK